MRTCAHGDTLELKSIEDFKKYEKNWSGVELSFIFWLFLGTKGMQWLEILKGV